MAATVSSLSHNGKTWVLNVSDEFGDNEVEVPVTDEKKEELEKVGIEIYTEEG